ncbi:MAG: hypothetical protein OEW87_10045 [Flavobacteriaceae bacterium]|nr:hypothetical protein [Flavobacteriaceae bacterium]
MCKKAKDAVDEVKKFRADNMETLNPSWLDKTIKELDKTEVY